MEQSVGEREAPEGDHRPTNSQTLTLVSPTGLELHSTSPERITTDSAEGDDGQCESEPLVNRAEILRALEIVEKDSLAISESFASLFASLRVALSGVTSNSVDHMQCFSDAAGRLQESVLDAATKGNRYINSCLRLNEEMKGIDNLATQLKILRRNVDVLDSAVNKLLRIP
ncbi:uncharacterized protein LOC133816843 [Humulus lupulus]|uniref:uncharacterized protein LOC133816843 n=1 Tax=Humulus lupulus TaxID=3486 RepID=UPI002B40242B|nr:uncharacterized protein LOC133816843 [Humulus lupulus]XP_062105131.1 uncharacterized protein LOC133816843 [Humulus lupulus]XP_062105132.1 uncharacterized protein LOC133816843 [Humulus lupulus]XP_062105133.1 uncharacterized protein LOC133816843 [Humulus lupulus]